MSGRLSPKVKIWISSTDYVEAEQGINLRLALKNHFSLLYNKSAKAIHCRGFGTCGTCSVIIDGPTSKPTRMEKWRLNFPPHKESLQSGLRLACQTKVLGDIFVPFIFTKEFKTIFCKSLVFLKPSDWPQI